MKNPRNTTPGKLKAIQGGSWKNSAYSCRTQTRFLSEPKKSTKHIGLALFKYIVVNKILLSCEKL